MTTGKVHRKVGEWRAVANGRAHKVRFPMRWGNGMDCAPNLNETGSAAYRRLTAKKTTAK